MGFTGNSLDSTRSPLGSASGLESLGSVGEHTSLPDPTSEQGPNTCPVRKTYPCGPHQAQEAVVHMSDPASHPAVDRDTHPLQFSSHLVSAPCARVDSWLPGGLCQPEPLRPPPPPGFTLGKEQQLSMGPAAARERLSLEASKRALMGSGGRGFAGVGYTAKRIAGGNLSLDLEVITNFVYDDCEPVVAAR